MGFNTNRGVGALTYYVCSGANKNTADQMKRNVDNYGCPLRHSRHFLSDRRLEGFSVPKELK